MRGRFRLAAVVLIMVTGIVLYEGREAPSPAPAPPPAPAADPAATPKARAVAPAPVTAADPEQRRHTLLLPDGTRVPALNGAVDPAPIADAWHPDVPWSPIVGRQTDPDGTEWYVHADGSRSTTRMRFRTDLGRMDAVTSVAHPTDSAPVSIPR